MEHLWEEYGEAQWLGIHTDGSGTAVWEDGEVFHDHEYNHFLDPSKLVANQFTAIHKTGQPSPWLTYNSSVVLNSVICQKTACSVDNYCPDNV